MSSTPWSDLFVKQAQKVTFSNIYQEVNLSLTGDNQFSDLGWEQQIFHTFTQQGWFPALWRARWLRLSHFSKAWSKND
jgi:hypothetical protein